MYVCVIYYNGLPLGSPRCPQGLSMLLSLKAFSTLTLGCRPCMKPKMAALASNVRGDDDTDGEAMVKGGFDTAFDNTQEVLRANAVDEEDEEELFEEEDAEEEVPREKDEP